jgi:FMN phosphatase YigB (HAD superfamily)
MKPVLFLDFDRTLFDTDKFYDWLGSDRFGRILAITGGTLAPPPFDTYLYEDTTHFLKRMMKVYRIVLLTYAVNTVLQRKKVRGSGIIPYLDDVLITQGEVGEKTGKGTAAAEYLHRIGDSGWEHVFVDDDPRNIDEVKRVNPEIRCIRIDRTTLAQGILHEGLLAPDHIVADLKELEALL